MRILYLSETFEGRKYHASGCGIGGHEVVWLPIAGNHPQLDALGDPELLLFGKECPERLSPYCRSFREELAYKRAFILGDSIPMWGELLAVIDGEEGRLLRSWRFQLFRR